MRRLAGVLVLGAALALPVLACRAQAGGVTINVGSGSNLGGPWVNGVTNSFGPNSYFGAPGFYGVGYGVPSFGVPRTWSAFSSPYGAGYGYGYAPYTYLPGPYGLGLWRPGFASPGYLYGASYYGTFPVPYNPWVGAWGVGPSMGYYAPGFGPPAW